MQKKTNGIKQNNQWENEIELQHKIIQKIYSAYIKEALWNWKRLIIPEILQNELDRNINLNTKFNSFSPYKQREFIEHITLAKKDKIQLVRLEKIILMLDKGKGLNNKYR